jgi:hypothetical protein
MRIRIEGRDLPGSTCGPSPDRPAGHFNIYVGVQRRNKPGELLGLAPGDSPAVTWTLDATLASAADGSADLKGPYIQGPPGGRFIYLNWGTVAEGAGGNPGAGGAPDTFALFRRAKLWLDAVPAGVLRDAAAQGTLVGRLGLTDAKGHPLCASVRPPLIEWSPAPE